jgi:hypothetical protein
VEVEVEMEMESFRYHLHGDVCLGSYNIDGGIFSA